MAVMLETYKHLTNSLVNRVNAQRGMNNRLRDAVLPRGVRKSFVQLAKLAAERQLAVGILAEASQRVPGNKFAITAVHTWFANIEETNLAVAALNENWQLTSDQLPAQAEWHRIIYKNTPAKAILLSQPVAGTAVANQPELLNMNVLSAVAGSVGHFASCLAEADQIAQVAAHNQVLLVPNVGLLTWANSLEEAIAFTETVNRMCEIILASTH
ncbi:MAG: class II aldolase/adducin family protein [Ardenticatenaceae bacterium]|nr:class II aldolase/adducin family protein [Anaerolineales bacterium]MCB8940953.1 class II aldolase/adducin family protein [Ardenticatenaceae bacterium]MCB8972292.1 class II aldolase/adducin family protein [Ardenticatenaceae bacterium]